MNNIDKNDKNGHMSSIFLLTDHVDKANFLHVNKRMKL